MKTVFEGTYAELQKQIALLPLGMQVHIRVEFAPEASSAGAPSTASETYEAEVKRPTLMEEIYSPRPRASFRTSRMQTASTSGRV